MKPKQEFDWTCPAQALKGTLWKAGMEREEIVDVETCYRKEKEIMTKATGIETDLCGKCFAVCAYTDRYLKRTSEEDAMCTLVKPDERYTAQIEAFKQEMLEAGSSMDGTGCFLASIFPYFYRGHSLE